MVSIERDHRIAPFVKEILLLENSGELLHRLPFYADGYPGIIYSEAQRGVLLLPQRKPLSTFFLYGQTIEPIVLQIRGAYRLTVFQLYPFATRLLLGIDPKEINDDCYDLRQLPDVDTESTIAQLQASNATLQVELISAYVLDLVGRSSIDPDNSIKLAVSTIIDSKGALPIKTLRERLFITERTFERRFANELGVTPKQFARIIQFSFSLNQLKESDYTKLTNIAYDNGFVDQSHFIRTFKKYTGLTPKQKLLMLA